MLFRSPQDGERHVGHSLTRRVLDPVHELDNLAASDALDRSIAEDRINQSPQNAHSLIRCTQPAAFALEVFFAYGDDGVGPGGGGRERGGLARRGRIVPRASSCSASAAPLRAAANVSVGQPPSVNLAGLPANLYLTAHDRRPLGCITSHKPEPPSLISRRRGPGLRFSIVFVVSFLVMRYPTGWGVTKPAVLPCYPARHDTAEQSLFVKQIRGRSAPVCSALLPVR